MFLVGCSPPFIASTPVHPCTPVGLYTVSALSATATSCPRVVASAVCLREPSLVYRHAVLLISVWAQGPVTQSAARCAGVPLLAWRVSYTVGDADFTHRLVLRVHTVFCRSWHGVGARGPPLARRVLPSCLHFDCVLCSLAMLSPGEPPSQA